MPDYPLATVGALVISPENRVLIIQTHKWKNTWGVPGGKIDYGETIREALLREFREETGLELFDLHWGPVQEAVGSPEFYKEAHFILLNFIARATTETVTLNEEAQAYTWVSAQEALAYPLNTPTKQLIEFYLEHQFSTAEVL
ncbi:MAG: NUDIX domain-containing protein [Trueperaceae bacterium]|nr:NUDIX domain-containing protein [Trueperaceae bacterium]